MKTTTLEVTRQIPATPEEVYAVWLDPACPGSPWFAPQTGPMSSKIIFNATVDGLFFHSVTNQGQTWYHYGRFTKLETGKLAEHTWVGVWTQGYESIVKTTFEAKDGGTLVTLEHSGVPDDEAGRRHLGGWQWCLGQLADSIASRRK